MFRSNVDLAVRIAIFFIAFDLVSGDVIFLNIVCGNEFEFVVLIDLWLI